MEAITFCPYCGKMLAVDFLFCPYCGESQRVDVDLENTLDEPFRRLAAVAERSTYSRLCALEKALGILEHDLDDYLEGK